ncbi:hypothetical protein KP509_1Z035900 [Ceratopteris richardii]|nr:hypothetical protein KP509_1Z035900 [Ceratopteris richardii]
MKTQNLTRHDLSSSDRHLVCNGSKRSIVSSLIYLGSKPTFSQKALWIDRWCRTAWAAERFTKGVVMSYSGIQNAEDMYLYLAASLKSCGKRKDLNEGCRLHAKICANNLLDRCIYLGNMLISMYANCGALDLAQQVLRELSNPDVVSWSSLIAGYARNGQGREALDCYASMQKEGFSPDAVTYSCVLKACGITKDIERGRKIHDEILGRGLLDTNVVLGNALVEMYAKCNAFGRAQEVLGELPEPNAIGWSVLIAGYVHLGLGDEALCCFQQMRKRGIPCCAMTYSCIIKACGIVGALGIGESIHNEVNKMGFLAKNVFIVTALIDMYMKCGAIWKARHVLDQLHNRSVASWNALITGYVQKNEAKEAMNCYEQMQSEGIIPDVITYSSILKACSITRAIEKGFTIRNEIINKGLLWRSRVLANTLMDMYVTFGMPSEAQNVFDQLPVRDIVSWSTLLVGYAHIRQGEKAFACYECLRKEGFSPNAITFVGVLTACSNTQNFDMGRQIHCEIVSVGLMDSGNIVLGNALVNMYAKCGLFNEAKYVLLGEFAARNIVSWNALISAYAQHEKGEEVLIFSEQMQSEGLYPDAITYSCVLKACGITKDLSRGKCIHREIANHGILKSNDVLGNALVDMYAKCGAVGRAHQVLEEMSIRSVISWSALIGGYAKQGQVKEAFDCFQHMRNEGIIPDVASWNSLIGGYAQQGQTREALCCFKWMQSEGASPDAITLICVLSACSHSGLVEKGQSYFENMSSLYGIVPDREHYTCMIDLYTRTGHFERALEAMRRMSLFGFPLVWATFLGACRNWGNLDLGRLAFHHLFLQV